MRERDIEALHALGRFRMLTRPQLRRWFFSAVSEPVVTRFLDRASREGWLGVERLGGNGIQVIWLTRKGREALIERGIPAADLFPSAGPAAAKDFKHTVEIGNAAAWLGTKEPVPDELLPAWLLQRLFGGRLQVIPDLLALWRSPEAALAVEVDLGTEPVATILLPKLARLRDTLAAWLPRSVTAIVVLVPSARRRDTLREGLAVAGLRVAVELLAVTAEPSTRTVKSSYAITSSNQLKIL